MVANGGQLQPMVASCGQWRPVVANGGQLWPMVASCGQWCPIVSPRVAHSKSRSAQTECGFDSASGTIPQRLAEVATGSARGLWLSYGARCTRPNGSSSLSHQRCRGFGQAIAERNPQRKDAIPDHEAPTFAWISRVSVLMSEAIRCTCSVSRVLASSSTLSLSACPAAICCRWRPALARSSRCWASASANALSRSAWRVCASRMSGPRRPPAS